MNADEITSRIQRIRDDEESGATKLARLAVQLLADLAADRSYNNDQFGDLFLDTTHQLARIRPSMASPINAMGFVVAAWKDAGAACGGEQARMAAGMAARRWLEKEESLASVVADHTAEVISRTVITHSYSTTVLRALEECWKREVLKRVIVSESRPLYEGRRTAAALVERGIPTSLVTEAEMGIFMAEADAVVVGADTLWPNGSLVNKVGTFLLALAARGQRVPFYTLAETHKVAPGPRKIPFVLEEKDPKEVLPEAIPGLRVRNVYFDLTPARYLTGYITERGLQNRQDIVTLARQAPGLVLA